MRNLINFIVWLSAGAAIGWIANWMVRVENRWTRKPSSGEDRNSKKS